MIFLDVMQYLVLSYMCLCAYFLL